MPEPDPASSLLVDPPAELALLAHEPSLAALAARLGVDLAGILAALARPPSLRLAPEASLRGLRLHEVLEALVARRIRFVLIGGLAARVFGSTHPTADVDICHARDPANLAALAALLREWGAEFRRPPAYAPAELSAAVFATETDFVFCTPLGKFDLIGEFTGVGRYAEAVRGAVPVRLGRCTVPVMSAPNLLASKRSTGRPRDGAVADELTVLLAIADLLAAPERSAVC